MAIVACAQAMELLNLLFSSGIIFNDGHEILARLQAGDGGGDIFGDLGEKFGKKQEAEALRQVLASWPPLHRELVRNSLTWALGKLDTEDRVLINWKGDDEHPETVTKLELRDHTLQIEFAHPPVSVSAA